MNTEIPKDIAIIEQRNIGKSKRAIYGYPLVSIAMGIFLFIAFLGLPVSFHALFFGTYCIGVLIGYLFLYKDYNISRIRSKIEDMYRAYNTEKDIAKSVEILKFLLSATGHALEGMKYASKKVQYTEKLLASGQAASKEYAEEFLRERNDDISYNKYLVAYYLEILLSIRDDLRSSMKLHIKKTEEARGEIEKNFRGSQEFLKTAEVQITRLDMQVDQFKEVEKVLVKI